MEETSKSNENAQLGIGAVSTCPFVLIGCTPVNPSFHADGRYWYLSQGVVGINDVMFIQKTLPNE